MLLGIIAAVFLLRYAFPADRLTVEELEIAESFMAGQTNESYALTGNEHKLAAMSDSESAGRRYEPVTRLKYQDRRQQLELNAADSSVLESLPLIGPVLAARTVKYRDLLGGFCTVEQLREVYGLSEETFLVVRDLVTADTALIRKLDINTATYGQLIRHPYLERADVLAILKYRELSGSLGSVGDISGNRLVDSARLNKLGPYLLFKK
jgi:DNA uptake protein ComE-like DNA-binding protein